MVRGWAGPLSVFENRKSVRGWPGGLTFWNFGKIKRGSRGNFPNPEKTGETLFDALPRRPIYADLGTFVAEKIQSGDLRLFQIFRKEAEDRKMICMEFVEFLSRKADPDSRDDNFESARLGVCQIARKEAKA
jgi:hypothetical protein